MFIQAKSGKKQWFPYCEAKGDGEGGGKNESFGCRSGSFERGFECVGAEGQGGYSEKIYITRLSAISMSTR